MARHSSGVMSQLQERILNFIRSYEADNGLPPTVREIQTGAGVSSTSMVSYHLKALETMGMLARRERSSRGLVLNDPHQASPRDIFSVPMVGVIVASAPAPTPDADALRSAEEYVYIAKSMVKTPGDLYALRVKGNSMIDALINDGDIVVMQKVNDINNGDLAAVRLMDRDETTLKRVFKEGKKLKLKPENPTMAPFYVDARRAEIQGRVMCVIRNA